VFGEDGGEARRRLLRYNAAVAHILAVQESTRTRGRIHPRERSCLALMSAFPNSACRHDRHDRTSSKRRKEIVFGKQRVSDNLFNLYVLEGWRCDVSRRSNMAIWAGRQFLQLLNCPVHARILSPIRLALALQCLPRFTTDLHRVESTSKPKKSQQSPITRIRKLAPWYID
jgi:hypothetical protein